MILNPSVIKSKGWNSLYGEKGGESERYGRVFDMVVFVQPQEKNLLFSYTPWVRVWDPKTPLFVTSLVSSGSSSVGTVKTADASLLQLFLGVSETVKFVARHTKLSDLLRIFNLARAKAKNRISDQVWQL